jgi:hypothetical protein
MASCRFAEVVLDQCQWSFIYQFLRRSCLENNVLTLFHIRSRYEIRVGQTFLTLTRFVQNTCNIYISK